MPNPIFMNIIKHPEMARRALQAGARASAALEQGPANDNGAMTADEWNAIPPRQRAEMKATDPEAYNAMRDAALGLTAPAAPKPLAIGGRAYEHLSNFERHRLKRRDPEAFDRLRANWVARGCPTADLAAEV